MSRVRRTTKIENKVYPILEQLTGGQKRNFETINSRTGFQLFTTWTGAFGYQINWFKGYNCYTWRSMVEDMPKESIKEFPEEIAKIKEMEQKYFDACRAMGEADRLRNEIIDGMKKKYCWNPYANFFNQSIELSDQEEALWRELKDNPEKVQALIQRAREIQNILSTLPKRGATTQKKTLTQELKKIKQDLLLVREEV